MTGMDKKRTVQEIAEEACQMTRSELKASIRESRCGWQEEHGRQCACWLCKGN